MLNKSQLHSISAKLIYKSINFRFHKLNLWLIHIECGLFQSNCNSNHSNQMIERLIRPVVRLLKKKTNVPPLCGRNFHRSFRTFALLEKSYLIPLTISVFIYATFPPNMSSPASQKPNFPKPEKKCVCFFSSHINNISQTIRAHSLYFEFTLFLWLPWLGINPSNQKHICLIGVLGGTILQRVSTCPLNKRAEYENDRHLIISLKCFSCDFVYFSSWLWKLNKHESIFSPDFHAFYPYISSTHTLMRPIFN